MGETIRVLVVDARLLVCKGISALLSEEADIEVVGEACSTWEAVNKVEALRSDVVLMDLERSELASLAPVETIRRMRARRPGVRILVLGGSANDENVFRSIRAGAAGYLLKNDTPRDLMRAIRCIHRGEAVFPFTKTRRSPLQNSYPSEPPVAPDPLTGREREVLQLLAEGKRNREISSELVITEATVRTHVSHILNKLRLSSRTQAAVYALREGLTSP